MSKLRSILFLVMALAWAPITWHCQLEVLPLLEFLACCDRDEAAPHQDSDCDTDGCAVVESGDYKIQEEQVFVLPPTVVEWLVESAAADRLDETSRRIFATAPPQNLHNWQFILRAALPVRAPSFAS